MRLYDTFLAAPALFPIYLSAAIVLSRSREVLRLECDMAAVHGCLSQVGTGTEIMGLFFH